MLACSTVVGFTGVNDHIASCFFGGFRYAGVLKREEASHLLEGKPSGTFLVRSRDEQLAISLV